MKKIYKLIMGIFLFSLCMNPLFVSAEDNEKHLKQIDEEIHCIDMPPLDPNSISYQSTEINSIVGKLNNCASSICWAYNLNLAPCYMDENGKILWYLYDKGVFKNTADYIYADNYSEIRKNNGLINFQTAPYGIIMDEFMGYPNAEDQIKIYGTSYQFKTDKKGDIIHFSYNSYIPFSSDISYNGLHQPIVVYAKEFDLLTRKFEFIYDEQHRLIAEHESIWNTPTSYPDIWQYYTYDEDGYLSMHIYDMYGIDGSLDYKKVAHYIWE